MVISIFDSVPMKKLDKENVKFDVLGAIDKIQVNEGKTPFLYMIDTFKINGYRNGGYEFFAVLKDGFTKDDLSEKFAKTAHENE